MGNLEILSTTEETDFALSTAINYITLSIRLEEQIALNNIIRDLKVNECQSNLHVILTLSCMML